ncbi:hypothetical protein [Neobacillus soli]|uniref:hypothetical protein n=1 Tax=Neobacillus soli TaxID=220688 RepID=UPI000824F452|nr:hypothetical protein [Neobacillus soli]
MKKIGLLLLAGALTLGLAACGGSDEGTTPKQSEKAAETTSSTASDVQEFTITASNWKFSADKELVVKKGTKVKINLYNKEGLHSISNDDLGIKVSADAPAEFTAEKTGEFDLNCNTVCGAEKDHQGMKISLKITD